MQVHNLLINWEKLISVSILNGIIVLEKGVLIPSKTGN